MLPFPATSKNRRNNKILVVFNYLIVMNDRLRGKKSLELKF